MFKKFYVVAVHEDRLVNAIRKLNEFNIEDVHLYELAGDNAGIWALGFKASRKHFMNFLGVVRVERILLESNKD